ncbi:MAG: response regulator [Planctomycetota bacterium]|jgi:CheY-like chemotaxis protein
MEQTKILIIDDDPDITEAMKIVLENQGYTVSKAKDGQEGMEQIKATLPNLIILDVMMDGMREGFVISRELKANPSYNHIPILMITAVKDKTGIDFKPAAGDEAWLPVEDFLDKPVKPELLLSKVRELLGES